VRRAQKGQACVALWRRAVQAVVVGSSSDKVADHVQVAQWLRYLAEYLILHCGQALLARACANDKVSAGEQGVAFGAPRPVWIQKLVSSVLM